MDPILLLFEFDELFTEFAIVEFEVEVMVEAVVGLVGGAPKSSKSLLPSLNSKSNMSGLRSVMSWMRSYKRKKGQKLFACSKVWSIFWMNCV